MDNRKKPSAGFWAATIIAPLGFYVATYLLLVETRLAPGMGMGVPNVAAYRLPGTDVHLESEFWRTVFDPLNRLDEKLRPRRWN